uniref:Ion transport domain-containing protein n=1 Tax=Parascaris univalens TaxID=6257 RepID=A0A915BGF6_PARUN
MSATRRLSDMFSRIRARDVNINVSQRYPNNTSDYRDPYARDANSIYDET